MNIFHTTGIQRKSTKNFLNLVARLVLLVVGTTLTRWKRVMTLLSFSIIVGILPKLRKITSMEVLCIIITLSQTMYLLSSLLMG